MKNNLTTHRAILSVCLSLCMMLSSGVVTAAKLEKCAGILKDRDKKAWVTVPKGTCEKLVGGTLVSAGEGRRLKNKEALVINPIHVTSNQRFSAIASASPSSRSPQLISRIHK